MGPKGKTTMIKMLQTVQLHVHTMVGWTVEIRCQKPNAAFNLNRKYALGCQNSGVYGNSCKERCPTNCRDNVCHIQKGYCFGCKPGWTGTTCITRMIEILNRLHVILVNHPLTYHAFSMFMPPRSKIISGAYCFCPVCHAVILSETLTLLITFEQWVLKLLYSHEYSLQ